MTPRTKSEYDKKHVRRTFARHALRWAMVKRQNRAKAGQTLLEWVRMVVASEPPALSLTKESLAMPLIKIGAAHSHLP